MTGKRLSTLAITSTHYQEAQKVDVANIISDFVHWKVIKRYFTNHLLILQTSFFFCLGYFIFMLH